MGGVSSGALPRPQGPPFPQAVLQLRCSQPPNCAARSPLPVAAEVPVPCSLPCTLANLCPREESGPDSGANLAPGSPWASQARCSPTRARDGCSGSFCVSHDGHMGNTAASKHPGFLTNTWGWTARAGFPAPSDPAFPTPGKRTSRVLSLGGLHAQQRRLLCPLIGRMHDTLSDHGSSDRAASSSARPPRASAQQLTPHQHPEAGRAPRGAEPQEGGTCS